MKIIVCMYITRFE